MSKVKTSILIERPNGEVGDDGEDILEEIEVDVSGDYHPFRRGAFERGGLQIDPDEPEMVEDIEATHNGKPIDLTEDEEEKAEEALLEVAQEGDDEPDRDDEPDYDPRDADYYDDYHERIIDAKYER